MDDENNRLADREKRPFWRRYLWQIITAAIALLVVLLIVLANTPFSSSLSIPKPVDMLCHSGSNDNWRGWHLASGWKRLNSVLLNDGTNGGYNGSATLLAPAPCQPKTMDYAVEATIQVVTFSGSNYSGFGINVRGLPSPSPETGYSTYIDSFSGANISVVGGEALNTASFNPGTAFHTYRAEVKGNTITFLIDGRTVLRVVDNKFISTGKVGLWCANAQIEMSSFEVDKL
jgi:hypothetical protein